MFLKQSENDAPARMWLVDSVHLPAQDDHWEDRPSPQHPEELASPTTGRKRVVVQRGDEVMSWFERLHGCLGKE